MALETTMQLTDVVAEGKTPLALDQYAQAIRSTEQGIFQRHHLTGYRFKFRKPPDKALELVESHHEIVKLFGVHGKQEKCSLFGLSGGSSHKDQHQLFLSLVERAVLSAALFGIPKTVQRFEKMLALSAKRELVGLEFTFVAGLNLETKWTIAEGLCAVPYDNCRREYLNAGAVFDYDCLVRHDPIVKGPEKPPPVAVFMQKFKWGPAIVKGSDPDWTRHWGNGGKWIDVASLVNLLSAIGNCPLVIIGQEGRAEPWFYELIGRGLDIGMNYFNRSPIDFIRRNRDQQFISPEKKAEFEKLVPLWLKFLELNKENSDRERIGLAISRLAGAVARTGSLAEEDKIIDVAIALEISYRSHRKDILPERVNKYLGKNPDECTGLKNAIKLLYDWRNYIVHGRNRENVQGSMTEAFSGGFDIAVRTIRTHLEKGFMPSQSYWEQTQ